MIKNTKNKNESNNTQEHYKTDMNTMQNFNEGNNIFDDINIESYAQESGYTLNKTAVIEYTVPEAVEECEEKRIVSIKLYDILGNLVIKLVEEEKNPGRHKCEFEADTIANGIYLCELRVGGYSSMKQMILQRQ